MSVALSLVISAVVFLPGNLTAAVAIGTPPQGKTVILGDGVTFSVTAAGTGTLTYQWKKNGVAIPGATSSTYTINPVAFTDAASYTVDISDTTPGTVGSGAAELLVNSASGGDLDFTFGNGMTGTAGFGSNVTVALRSDGKVVIGGSFGIVNGVVRNGIARLNSDGSLDTSFGNGLSGIDHSSFNAPDVAAIALQSDGKTIIGGEFTSVNGINCGRLARLNSDGNVDTSFNAGAGTMFQLRMLPDGRFLRASQTGNAQISRHNTNGWADTSFGNGANGASAGGVRVTGDSEIVYSTAIQSDGKILIGGGFTQVSGVNRGRIARLSSNGVLDTTFGNGLSGIGGPTYPTIQTISVQGDGRIVTGGRFTSVNGTARSSIARLNSDGSLDTSFNPVLTAPGSNLASVLGTVLQSDGKIIIAGYFSAVNGTARNCIARLHGDGTLDPTFGDGMAGVGGTSGPYIKSIALQTNGAVIVGGSFFSYNGTFRGNVARLLPSGADADLAGISFGTGTLSPSFHSGRISHAAAVPFAASSITVTPTASDPGATVRVNGVIVPPGSASAPVSLVPGNNVVTVAVTAPNGSTLKTYTFNVSRAGSPPVAVPAFSIVDRTARSVALDGSGSTSPSGGIVDYQWSWQGGNAGGVNPTATLPPGVTEVTLTVIDGIGATASATFSVDLTAEATFGAAALEAAVRTALAMPTGPITAADMLTLTNLDLSGLGITDLSGLELATNLRILNIRGNAFPDPAALWAVLDQLTLYCLYTDVPRPGGNPAGRVTQSVTDTSGGTFYITVDALNLPAIDISGLGIDTSNSSNIVALQVIADAGVTVETGGANLPPAAVAGFTITDEAAGQVQLDGTASRDLDGSIVTHAWSWAGSSASGPSPAILLPVGITSVTLTVTDDDGASNSTVIPITLNNPAERWFYSGALDASVPSAIATGRLTGVSSAAAGGNNSAVVQADGSALIWGDHSSGQLSVPPQARSGVSRLAIGGGHVVALKLDGSLHAWGYNDAGQATVPPAAQSGIQAVSASYNFTLALTNSGQVIGWGDNFFEQTTIPLSAQSGVTAIAAGESHALAVGSGGQVIAWGYNGNGQTDVPAAAASGVIRIAGGRDHSLALKSNGQVVAWGSNDYGQADPPLEAQTGVIAIASGTYFSAALKQDGSVITWGEYVPGYLSVPAEALSGVVEISAGSSHVVARKSDGSIVAWGIATSGENSVPSGVGSGVSAIASNNSFSLAVDAGGGVVGWGNNSTGQLNIPPAATSGITAVATGALHSVALNSEGSVLAWGGISIFGTITPPPAAESGVTAIAAGEFHTLALKADGSVIAWGNNGSGQSTVPAGALSGVSAIAAAYRHNVALKADGSVLVWGNNTWGQRDVPATAGSGVSAIATGVGHVLALKSNGSVIAWGSDEHGQSTVPAAASSGVIAISAGSHHSVALKSNGTVVAWGFNDVGQTLVPDWAQGQVVRIVAGGNATFHRLGVVVEPPVVFADANLETAIRAALLKPTGPITGTDMLTLTSLNLGGLGITDLGGLASAANLRILDIRNNPFANAAATWGILDQLSLYCLYTNLPRPGGTAPGLLTEAVSTGVGGFFITVDPVNLPSLDISGLGIDTTNPANLDALDRIAAAGVTVVTGAGNLPPAATGTAAVTSQATGATTLNGSASRDIDGSVVAWAWTWAGGSAAGVNPTAILPVGTTTVTLAVTDDDGATSSTTLEVQVLGAPEIVIEQPAATELAGANPTVTFPSRGVGRAGEATVFTLRNSGTAGLLGIVVQLAPAGTDFSLDLTGTATSLAPGATTTFSILFTPSETGPRTASLMVASNDADENPATIGLTGVGLAPEWLWTNFSGQAGGQGNADGTGAAARFDTPGGMVADGNGGFFIADSNNHIIRRISSTGVVTPFAGSTQIQGSTNGIGTAAMFRGPSGLAMKPGGTLVVADTINHTIRQISPGGVVTLLAGQPGVIGSQSGSGTGARFLTPRALAVDQQMNIYVADSGNHTIRKIDISGEVTLFAGAPGQAGSVNGPKLNARFNDPRGVAVDPAGIVYVAEWGSHTLRKIDPVGNVTTLAGSAGNSGSTDGAGPGARFNRPSGIARGPNGMILVADTDNHVVRLVDPAGNVSTVAGLAATSGDADGTGAAARFRSPVAVAADSTGTFVADTANCMIRKIDVGGLVTTLAGTSPQGGNVDGNLAVGRYLQPGDGVFDAAGNLYIADTGNHNIRKILPDGTVSVFAGGGVSGFVNGTGTTARFNRPSEIVLAPNGNLLVSDKGNGRIRQITPAGEVTTYAGIGGAGLINGTALSARFNNLHGMAFDSHGNLFIADSFNHVIRKLDTSGNVTTFAGAGGQISGTDGNGASARFNQPTGLAIDPADNLYVTCAAGHTIRKITPAAEVTTLAGADGIWGGADGSGAGARFWNPQPITWHPDGYLIAGDWLGHTIRRIDPSGEVTTLGGLSGAGTDADGYGQESRFSRPAGIVVRPDLSLLVMDSYNNRLVTGTPPVTDGVEFSDPLLEAAIRSALAKPAGQVTGADMLTLTNLNLSGLGLTDLGGLETAASLRILNIRGNAFANPAALWVILDQLSLYCLYTDVPRPGANPLGLLTQSLTDTMGRTFYITVNAPNLPTLDVSGLDINTANPANQSALQAFSSAGINVIGVPNYPPVARASATVLDLAARSVRLDGGSSSDPDGSISAWAWTWTGGSATGISPTVTLPIGVTTITLNVTDDDGAANGTTVTVSLDPGLITAFSAAGLTGSDSLPDATPFSDGVENLLKYAFNMNLAGPDAATMEAGGNSGLPVIAPTGTGAATVLRFEYVRRIGSGLVYTPKKSTSLGAASWTSLSDGPTVTPIGTDGLWERVTYEEPSNPALVPVCFGRVEVAIP